jgi:hypothetical protein
MNTLANLCWRSPNFGDGPIVRDYLMRSKDVRYRGMNDPIQVQQTW